MNTANRFKVGDLVSMRLTRYKVSAPTAFHANPNAMWEPVEVVTNVIARRVVRVKGDYVYLRLGGKTTGVPSEQVRLVY